MFNLSFSDNGSNITTNAPADENLTVGDVALGAILLICTPATIICILFIIAISTEKTIPGTIRLVLVNIILASQAVICGFIGFFLGSVILSKLVYLQPSGIACRFLYITVTSGSAARLLYMAAFASTVYIVVHHGVQKLRFPLAVILSLVLWFFAVAPNFVLLSPAFIGIFFTNGDACTAFGAGAGTYIYAFLYLVIYGFASFAVSIPLALLSLCFVIKNTISGETTLLKGMIKFALFLLIGNTINVVGISIPQLIIAFVPHDSSSEASQQIVNNLDMIEGVILLLSLIPTPIFILIFFRPIRQRFKKIMCFTCLKVWDAKLTEKQHSSIIHNPGTALGTLD